MEFQNLEQYYDYLENDSKMSFLDFNTPKFLTALKDKIEDEGLKKLCLYELFFSEFSIKKGVHIPKFQSGENIYPSLEHFDDNFEYIKKRAKDVVNPKYKAKYNHLLWLSPNKHIEFAKEAIDSYFSILKNNIFTNHENQIDLTFCKYYENLLVLSQTINYKKDETISYFLSLLEGKQLSEFTKYSLMNFIVTDGKNIETSIYSQFYHYSIEIISNLDSRILEKYLKLLIILSQKLKISSKEFHEKLGDYQITQLKAEKNQGFVAHYYYKKALDEYRKANNKEKIEQTAVLLEQSKKDIDLKKISVEIKDEDFNKALSMIWEQLKLKISELAQNGDDNSLYCYLISENIFPNAEDLSKEISSPILELMSVMTFDINRNISTNKKGGINPYFLYFNNFSVRHISLVFSEGIKCGKISFASLIQYLKENSWYGQDFTYVDNNNELQGFNWIELLSPSLKNFFTQTEIDMRLNSNDPQNYLLSIDSLVLKFEGLLREFSKMIGAQTIEINESGTSERINFEKLLDNAKLQAIIPKGDIAFFKFLFTSQGINLRNNIAHCFYKIDNYSSGIMLLLIVSLLRLGNYEKQSN